MPRREKAQKTRAAICAAAKALFLERGYSGTTIQDIAKAAGVAHQTVYFVFGSKAAILSAITDAEIVGDLEPVPLLERAPVKRLPEITDPGRRLQELVVIAADVTERVAPLYEIVRGGAADADVQALLDRHEEQRWRTLGELVSLLDGGLAAGVTPEEATDRLYALTSHETYWLLVKRRGWAATRWREYVATEAIRQLVGE